MKRNEFLTKTSLLIPAAAIMGNLAAQKSSAKKTKPFIVDAGKSRFGEVVKFLGVFAVCFFMLLPRWTLTKRKSVF